MDPNKDASLIDAIASQTLGDAPAAPTPPAAPATPAAAAPAEQDTPADKTAEAGSPTTEGDKMAADPIVYEVEFGEGDTRKLTPQQIRATQERYAALNHKHAQNKPAYDVVDAILAANPNANPTQVAEALIAMAKSSSGQQPATFGAEEQAASQNAEVEPAKSNQDIDAELKRWEDENATSLPPGYREFLTSQTQGASNLAAMQASVAQMREMMGAVLARTQGVADAARQTEADTQVRQISAVQQAIANNLDRAQAALQLPDEAANDFQMFAAERGYTMEDFADPNLTLTVMQDFKNAMNSPEMERMRAMAQRRQAYTGTLGSSPGSSAPASPAVGEDPRLASLIDEAMG